MATSRQKEFAFGAVRNSGLLSTHWLSHRLRLEPEWTERRADAMSALADMATLWKKQRGRVAKFDSEASLEYAFIQPVFEILGWTLDYQTVLQGRAPDYALFLSSEDFDRALEVGKSHPDYWAYPAVVADAKAWQLSLDRRNQSTSKREFPPQQIEWYIDRSRLPFGILTNGEQWRLIPRERLPFQGRFDTYLEIRLCELLEKWLSPKSHLMEREHLEDDFFQFYLFFSPKGYVAHPDRQSLVVRAIQGSSGWTDRKLGMGRRG